MLACLYREKVTPDYVLEIVEMTPFERLHMLVKDDSNISELVSQIESRYEQIGRAHV